MRCIAGSSFSKELFSHGLAARCEAMALPRRTVQLSYRAMPLVRSLTCNALITTRDHRGHSPNQGRSPNRSATFTARQSHRLTSGGTAVNNEHYYLVAALLLCVFRVLATPSKSSTPNICMCSRFSQEFLKSLSYTQPRNVGLGGRSDDYFLKLFFRRDPTLISI